MCGMMVDPQKAAGKVEHNGKNYYFCSARCAERFRNEPEKFLAAPGAAGMEHQAGRLQRLPPRGMSGIPAPCIQK